VLAWVAGEQVIVGTRRTYEGVEYECLQSHVTQSDWTPPATPSLWAVVVAEPEPSAEWAVGVAYSVGDVVTYQGRAYQCRQAHTSISTWTPAAVQSLWQALPELY
jgi:chitodextrinase